VTVNVVKNIEKCIVLSFYKRGIYLISACRGTAHIKWSILQSSKFFIFPEVGGGTPMSSKML